MKEFLKFLVHLAKIDNRFKISGSNALNILVVMQVALKNQNFENIRISNTSLFGECEYQQWSQFTWSLIFWIQLMVILIMSSQSVSLLMETHQLLVVMISLSVYGMSKQDNKKPKLDGHQYQVNSVCLSTDGNTLASGSSDKSIRLWEIKNKHYSDYRFKEIQVKNAKYPFFNTLLQKNNIHKIQIHLILWFTQTSLFQGQREFFIKNRFHLGELLQYNT
ncbi:unnamed protein product [Paramecium primaurelia]|uniref:Uncharacterized protein n=1 Tax=Paramecium primaurelia TaxID=5886 RepID=A0A8S1NPD5_PARPR|nr:unnamed protein product [Paramecium primaurelia]